MTNPNLLRLLALRSTNYDSRAVRPTPGPSFNYNGSHWDHIVRASTTPIRTSTQSLAMGRG